MSYDSDLAKEVAGKICHECQKPAEIWSIRPNEVNRRYWCSFKCAYQALDREIAQSLEQRKHVHK